MAIASPTVKGKIVDYVVEYGADHHQLRTLVSERMNDGYVLYGFPFTWDGVLAQGLLKYEKGAYWPNPQQQQKKDFKKKPASQPRVEIKHKSYKIDRSKV